MPGRIRPDADIRGGFAGIFGENAGMPVPGMVPIEVVDVTSPDAPGSDLAYEPTGIQALTLWLNATRPIPGTLGFAVSLQDRYASWSNFVPACVIHLKATITAARGWTCYTPNDSWPSPGWGYIAGVTTYTNLRYFRYPVVIVKQSGIQKALYIATQNANGSWTLDTKHPGPGSSGPLTVAGTYDFEFHFPGHAPVTIAAPVACGDTHDFAAVNLPTYDPNYDMIDNNVFFNANTNIGRISAGNDGVRSFEMPIMPMHHGPATYPPFSDPDPGGSFYFPSGVMLDNDHLATTHEGFTVDRFRVDYGDGGAGSLHGIAGYYFQEFDGQECLYMWEVFPGNNIAELFGSTIIGLGGGADPPPREEWNDYLGVHLSAGRFGFAPRGGIGGGIVGYDYSFLRLSTTGGRRIPDVQMLGFFSIKDIDFAARPIAWDFPGLSKEVASSVGDPAFDCVAATGLQVTRPWAGWPPSL